MEKQCSKCRKILPLNFFNKNRSRADGLAYYCKACCAAAQQKWRASAQEKYSYPYSREQWLRREYGLTTADVENMRIEQSNTCKICGDSFTKMPHIDHCHETGQVRGLLCHHCNTGLGNFRDNSDILANAIEYLQQTKVQYGTKNK